jgi:hypothetical protein
LAVGAVNHNPALTTNPAALTSTVHECKNTLQTWDAASVESATRGAISGSAFSKVKQCHWSDQQSQLAACQEQMFAAAGVPQKHIEELRQQRQAGVRDPVFLQPVKSGASSSKSASKLAAGLLVLAVLSAAALLRW